MANQPEFWAFSEKSFLFRELISGAVSLAAGQSGLAAAIVIGSRTDAEQALSFGARKVYWLGERGNQLLEDFVPTLAQLAKAKQPAGLLIGATKRGRGISGRLSAMLGAVTLTDLRKVEFVMGEVRVSHMVYGGGAIREEKPKGRVLLATAGEGVFEPLPVDPGRSGQIETVAFVEPAWKVALLARKPKPAASVNLSAARRVVCLGRGIGKREDLALMDELARLLEAEIGCTRPLSEGQGWLPRECYIGVSGAIIKPDLYLGIGISGQVQHTVGVSDARLIVAINKDPHAPIFDQSDYGIVGDLYTVVPALIRVLKARAGG